VYQQYPADRCWRLWQRRYEVRTTRAAALLDARLVGMTRRVELLTRDGCSICARAYDQLKGLAEELGFELSATDVDAAAGAGEPGLRAEFGDRLPVVLLDGSEHSYWEVDEARLRADLARPDVL
jgi:glutaredoxin